MSDKPEYSNMRIVRLGRPSGPRFDLKNPFVLKNPLRSRNWLIAVGVFLALVIAVLAWGATALHHPWGDAGAANLLIIGTDELEYNHARSDTVMLAHIQVEPTRSVSLVSLPRDTRVALPGYSGYHKLNAAFSYGGIALARQTVVKTLSVPVDHYVVLNTQGLEALVDSVGGVDINVPEKMNYDDNCAKLHIHFKPGLYHMTGQQVMEFVRFRHDPRGDLGRAARQQIFMRALVKQVTLRRVVSHWSEFRAALGQAIDTDMTPFQMAGVASILCGHGADVHTSTLPGRPRDFNKVSFYEINPTKAHTALTCFRGGQDSDAQANTDQ